MSSPPHSLKWHERNVLAKAMNFVRVFDTTPGFGRPIAVAGTLLSDAARGLSEARQRGKILGRHE